MAIQANGSVVMLGRFTAQGQSRSLCRLHADGSLDTNFPSGYLSTSDIKGIIAQRDGQIVLPGGSTEASILLAKIRADGTVDSEFGRIETHPYGTVYENVTAAAVQPDGRIVIGRSRAGTEPRDYLARLWDDGSCDRTFASNRFGLPSLVNGNVLAVTLQLDGRILIGGTFTQTGSLFRNRIARMLPDGTPDPSFDPGGGVLGDPATAAVRFILLQPDLKILIGGSFTTVNGWPRAGLARLNSDGSLDMSFDPGSGPASGDIEAVVLQGDGRVLVGGAFRSFGGVTNFARIARLHPDGSPDLTFQTGAGVQDYSNDIAVKAIVVQPDGKIVIGGNFWRIDSTYVSYLARLNGGPFSAPSIVFQPSDRTVTEGRAAALSVRALGLPEPRYQWRFNGSDLAGETFPDLLRPDVRGTNAGHYTVVLSNALGVVTSTPALLTVLPASPHPGALDVDYLPVRILPGPVRHVAPTLDGKLVIAGSFTNVGGLYRRGLARLHADGSPDETFDAGMLANQEVKALAVLPDGKLLVGGLFTKFFNGLCNGLARLNADGSMDPGFQVEGELIGSPPGYVTCLALLPNGRLLIGGRVPSTDLSGSIIFSRGVAKLLPDGQWDRTFTPFDKLDEDVNAVGLLPDQRIVIYGRFTRADYVSLNRVGRLHANGELDSSFQYTAFGPWAAGNVAAHPDGRMILTGSTFGLGAETPARQGIVRLNADGSVDMAYQANITCNPGCEAKAIPLALQGDGKAIIGGTFTGANGLLRPRIARLLPDGTLDLAFNPGEGADDEVTSLALLPDGKIMIAGLFMHYDGAVRPGLARLHGGPFSAPVAEMISTNQSVPAGQPAMLSAVPYAWPSATLQWFHNGQAVPGATNPVLALPNLRPFQAGDYALVASNALGVATSEVSTVTVTPYPFRPGGVDLDFYPELDNDSAILSVAVQSDGKVLVGGRFAVVHGHYRRGIARLHPDGRLDESFEPGLGIAAAYNPWPSINAILPEPGGKTIVAGYFTSYDGIVRTNLVRLNADGTLDSSFRTLPHWRNTLYALVPWGDGRILVGGNFTNADPAYARIVRLMPDGTLDPEFSRSASPERSVYAVALDAQKRIVISGAFTNVGGFFRSGVARLHTDGTVDPTFNPGTGIVLTNFTIQGIGPGIYAMAIQPSGKIVLGGIFTSFDGHPCSPLVRLNPDGSWDPTWTSILRSNDIVRSLIVQRDGKVLVGWRRMLAAGEVYPERHGVTRLHPDGQLDDSFATGSGLTTEPPRGVVDPGADGLALAQQPDGRVLVAGVFFWADGIPRTHLVRLLGDPLANGPAMTQGRFGLTVATTIGKSYGLEFKASLCDSNWTALPRQPGNGMPLRLTDPAPGTSQRFYRVSIE